MELTVEEAISLSSLWMPILLSGVFIFIASSVLHMVVKIHNKDYQSVPGEESIRDAIRGQKISPGLYVFPHCHSMKEMGTPEHMEKLNQGPNGFLTITPDGPPAMGKNLFLWFLYALLISLFVGYLTSISVASGAPFKEVFRIAGTAAVLGHCVPSICDSIWKCIPWPVTFKFIIDGAVYSVITAATFGWLWP